MSMFGGLESAALGGALSIGGSLLGGKKKQKPLFKLEPAYYMGLNQQNEQRGLALGALDRYGDFMYGTRTQRWSPYGMSPSYPMQPGRQTGGGGGAPSMQAMLASMPRNLGPQGQKDYIARMQSVSGGAVGTSPKRKNLGTSENVPGMMLEGTNLNVPLPWGPGTVGLGDYEGNEIGGGGPSFIDMLGAAGSDATGELDSLAGQYFGESSKTRGDADALYRKAVDEARGFGDMALAEINQNYADTVRQESNRISGSLASRGFGGSTMMDAEIANTIVPNALAGKLAALSNTRNAQAGMVTNASLQRAGAFQQGGDTELARRYGLIPQRAATSDSYRQQLLNAYAEPERMRANLLAQPSAVYFGPYTKGNVPNSGNFQPQSMGFGDRIAGIGGQLGGMLLNYGLSDYLRGGRGGSGGGGIPSGGGGSLFDNNGYINSAGGWRDYTR